MAKKRKFDSQPSRLFTSGPIDSETNQRSAFPVKLADENITTDVPLDGFDYLRMVRNQARKAPSFTFSEKQQAHMPTPAVEQESRETKASGIYEEWQIQFLARFRELRRTMSSILMSKSNFPSTQNSWLGFVALSNPTYKNLRSTSNPVAIQFLSLSAYWLENEYTPQLAKWIFAFLVRVDDTLEFEEVSVLRDLAKKSWDLKDTGEIGFRAICEMVIVIVSEIFGQHDLRKVYEPQVE
ncbi:Survival of motor neuron protein-interacting protein yip1 [Neolecta irregularis DAH-3]|uniref:Survival of motor neuron protein-interacting protein yip1 n=1 Tax=Neolecta irregularis (strain DAH-3) TaxID=1198029 RepID=A0A1U7LT09_NEOID|nr:Survival of motor neuron protein-interacting protein yip1 [Neolecta irregularis DAH-3]|eukprot:OLL25797.1 Survival of motor neuron protein-interacting protein yip1 [Neolecta irregularis DAH-3]